MMGVRIIIVSAVIQLVQRNSYRVLQLLLAIPWGDKSVTKKKRFVGQPKPTVLRRGYTQKKRPISTESDARTRGKARLVL